MSSKPNVVVIKVHRNQAGNTIPFDKLYFYRREDRELIPKNFGYALVLPGDDPTVADELVKLKPRKMSHFKYHRDDTATGISVDLDGRKHTAAQIKAWWEENLINPFDLWNRVVVIPILTAKVRKKLHPRYLASSRWYQRQDVKQGRRRRRASLPTVTSDKPKGAIHEMAYLATPHAAPYDVITPICHICPRLMLHLQGECVPGQRICFKSLDFATIDTPPPNAADVADEPDITNTDSEDTGDIAAVVE